MHILCKNLYVQAKEGVSLFKQHLPTIIYIKNVTRWVHESRTLFLKYPPKKSVWFVTFRSVFRQNTVFTVENENFRYYSDKYCKRSVKSESWYSKKFVRKLEITTVEQNMIFFSKKMIFWYRRDNRYHEMLHFKYFSWCMFWR